MARGKKVKAANEGRSDSPRLLDYDEPLGWLISRLCYEPHDPRKPDPGDRLEPEIVPKGLGPTVDHAGRVGLQRLDTRAGVPIEQIDQELLTRLQERFDRNLDAAADVSKSHLERLPSRLPLRKAMLELLCINEPVPDDLVRFVEMNEETATAAWIDDQLEIDTRTGSDRYVAPIKLARWLTDSQHMTIDGVEKVNPHLYLPFFLGLAYRRMFEKYPKLQGQTPAALASVQYEVIPTVIHYRFNTDKGAYFVKVLDTTRRATDLTIDLNTKYGKMLTALFSGPQTFTKILSTCYTKDEIQGSDEKRARRLVSAIASDLRKKIGNIVDVNTSKRLEKSTVSLSVQAIDLDRRDEKAESRRTIAYNDHRTR